MHPILRIINVNLWVLSIEMLNMLNVNATKEVPNPSIQHYLNSTSNPKTRNKKLNSKYKISGDIGNLYCLWILCFSHLFLQSVEFVLFSLPATQAETLLELDLIFSRIYGTPVSDTWFIPEIFKTWAGLMAGLGGALPSTFFLFIRYRLNGWKPDLSLWKAFHSTGTPELKSDSYIWWTMGNQRLRIELGVSN